MVARSSKTVRPQPITIQWRVKNPSIPLCRNDDHWTTFCTLPTYISGGKEKSRDAESIMIVNAMNKTNKRMEFRLLL
jgi:hypothetical protein